MKSVCVIGGGAAGLSAAVFLAKEKFKVTLIESKPRLGGRAYSFFDKSINQYIDNGQHILASWYKMTFEFLKIIGTYDKLNFQKRLEIDFRDLDGKAYKLKSPFNFFFGIITYDALSFKDNMCLLRFLRKVRSGGLKGKDLKDMNTDVLFVETEQTVNLIKSFWEPFIVAVFNAKPKDTSALLFVEMIKMGFIENGNSQLVLPRTNLNEMYVDKSFDYLKKNDAEVLLDTKIEKINFTEDKIESMVLESGEELKFDYYISAVPFFDFKSLVGEEVYNKEFSSVSNLETSPIINIHLTFDENINDILVSDFIGVLGAIIQWVFKVNDKQVCVVISDAKDLADKDKDELAELATKELNQALPETRSKNVTYSKVVKEMRATFLPNKESLNHRPGFNTKYSNFFLAGDWTDTGYPATIEGAALSAKKCVNEIKSLNSINN